MTGRAERTKQDASPERPTTSGGTRNTFELANAVEHCDAGEPAVCYVYPAHASDAELETRWLRAPAALLVDLSEVC
jgi:hypothetical protein